ncbi:two-component sensor histidine kinase, partial [Pseudomonas protegens]
MRRLSLSGRLALLFAACTAVVSLLAGVLFSRASEAHFIELDQQLLDGKLLALRSALQDVNEAGDFPPRQARLQDELSHQPDLQLRVGDVNGQLWFDSAPDLPASLPGGAGLRSLEQAGT